MPYGAQYSNRQLWKNPPRSKSGLKGVCYQPTTWIGRGEVKTLRKPWKAYMRKCGVYELIGYFATKEEAARAYNLEAMRHYGREAYLNPIRP